MQYGMQFQGKKKKSAKEPGHSVGMSLYAVCWVAGVEESRNWKEHPKTPERGLSSCHTWPN